MAEELSPEEVEARREELQIVDIRSPVAFEQGHIPGAVNLPFPELPRRVGEYDWGEEVVVVCPVGKSSIQAARLLKSYEGVDDDATVASMAGGYEEWGGELEGGADGSS